MIAIIGTVGVPALYGGFETLAENLVRYHHERSLSDDLHVYCSGVVYKEKPDRYLSATLHYLPLSANGAQSIFYDIWSLLAAVSRGADRILLLGVSGATILPFIRLFSRARIITNIDGVEWRRDKWKWLSKWFLRFSERIAVSYSHGLIADNTGISDYVQETYGRSCKVIAYGGDHAIQVKAKPFWGKLPERYALAICRVEPENNVEMILDAFSRQEAMSLVFVGNWHNSVYGERLFRRYGKNSRLLLLEPIYDVGVLRYIRERALLYVHGHSAGGTNPSLVEMMHFGVPIAAYDCVYNRYTTDGCAWYFADTDDLIKIIVNLEPGSAMRIGAAMLNLARTKYTWDKVGAEYFELLSSFE